MSKLALFYRFHFSATIYFDADKIHSESLEPLAPPFLQQKYGDSGITARFRTLHNAIGCAPEQEEEENRSAASVYHLDRQASSPILDNIARSVSRRDTPERRATERTSPWSAHRISRLSVSQSQACGRHDARHFATPTAMRGGSPLVPLNYMTPQPVPSCCSCKGMASPAPGVAKGRLRPQRLFWSPPLTKSRSRLSLHEDGTSPLAGTPSMGFLSFEEAEDEEEIAALHAPIPAQQVTCEAVATFHDRHKKLLMQWGLLPWRLQYAVILCLMIYEEFIKGLRSLAKDL